MKKYASLPNASETILASLESLASFAGLSNFMVFSLYLLARGELTKRQLRKILNSIEACDGI